MGSSPGLIYARRTNSTNESIRAEAEGTTKKLVCTADIIRVDSRRVAREITYSIYRHKNLIALRTRIYNMIYSP